MQELMLVTEENTRLDLLDRQEFIDQMLKITKVLSEKKKNACYAVDGSWGVGKSFVLDMFEEQAEKEGQEGEEQSRFLIFRYNCWEYDYYEEPLVAIVASILDQFDEKVNLLPEETKTDIKSALKAIGKGLLIMGAQVVKEKTGFDAETVIEAVTDSEKTSKDDNKNAHDYDQYFDFKKELKELRDKIETLSEDQTILFVVDELDRCLPEYTVKVLERLHHLFEGLDNVQVVLSVDEGQLEHTVKQIFGEGTDVKRYLRKFINFELKLNEGTIHDNFNTRFDQYTNSFELKYPTTKQDKVNEFITNILAGYDMRSRIAIIDRCALLHSLLGEEEIVVDSSYLCLEILLVILHDCGLNIQYMKENFDNSNPLDPVRFDKDRNKEDVPKGVDWISAYYSTNRVSENDHSLLFGSKNGEPFVNAGCLTGKLLGAYRALLGFNEDCFSKNNDPSGTMSAFLKYGKEFWELLQIVG